MTWTVPFDVPVSHPIVSDCGSESYQITEYIDHFINPLPKLHSSYIEDTYEFVNKIKKPPGPGHALLFSIYSHHPKLKLKHNLQPGTVEFLDKRAIQDGLFVVAPGGHDSLLGDDACEKLGLVKRIYCINTYPHIFEGFGFTFHLHDTAKR